MLPCSFVVGKDWVIVKLLYTPNPQGSYLMEKLKNEIISYAKIRSGRYES